MPHGIAQCHLPPGRGDIPALNPAEAGTRLSDPGWMQGRVVCAERPVELVEPLKDARAVERGKATLSCRLSRPRKKVAWFRNGVELTPTEPPRYSIVSDDCEYTLTLDDCRLDDAAQYSMRCQNVDTSATLTVDGMSCCMRRLLQYTPEGWLGSRVVIACWTQARKGPG